MSRIDGRRRTGVLASLLFCACALSCGDSTSPKIMVVSLSNTETFTYPTVNGIEDGVTIAVQPQHAAISEIRRDAETNWVVTYFYRPVTGFVGSDSVRLEIHTSSGGVSPSTIRHVWIQFKVRE